MLIDHGLTKYFIMEKMFLALFIKGQLDSNKRLVLLMMQGMVTAKNHTWDMIQNLGYL